MTFTVNSDLVVNSGGGGGGGSGDAQTSDPLSQFAATSSAQFAGVISDETGTGLVVLNTSPTLVTPALGTPASGVATNLTGTATGLTSGITNALKSASTTVNVSSATAPSTGQALVATDSTHATWQSLPGGGDALTSGTLAQFAATTSAELAGVISNETGSGLLVFATSPTLTTPLLGTPTSGTLTNCTGLPVAGITASTSTALGVGSVELGHASDTTIARVSAGLISVEGVTVVDVSTAQTLTNKTLTSPAIASPTLSGTVALTGDFQLPENKSILLDAALSADGKWSGIAEAGTLGETVAFGEFVYLKAADSQWYKTDADADATAGAVRIGCCVVAGNDNDVTTILLYGKVRADSLFPTFTIAAPVYLSTTAGAVTNTQPSGTDDVIRIVGYGNTGDELFVQPSNDYMTHT